MLLLLLWLSVVFDATIVAVAIDASVAIVAAVAFDAAVVSVAVLLQINAEKPVRYSKLSVASIRDDFKIVGFSCACTDGLGGFEIVGVSSACIDGLGDFEIVGVSSACIDGWELLK